VKECNRSLKKKGISDIELSKSLSSYLRKCFLLNIFNALLQGDHFSGQDINVLTMLLAIVFEELNLLLLPLHIFNKIVHHISQLADLDVLSIDMVV
jgi:hypothetical protein